MTVSNAFSRPDQLSPDLRRQILAAADVLGYVGPDPSARALARGATGAIGVLLTDSLAPAFTDEVAAEFLGAIAARLAPTGLALTLLTSSGRDDIIPARDVAIDGALVYSCEVDSPAVDWLRRRRIPLVFVDQEPAVGSTCINIDDRAAARAIAQYLVDLGHRRFAIVTASLAGPHGILAPPAPTASSYIARQRMHGWLDALNLAGSDAVMIQQPYSEFSAGFDSARHILDTLNPVTAILCLSDVMARGVVEGAQSLGLRVPDDVSVVGFDDSPVARRMHPTLTTVRQNTAAKGDAAASALIDAIAQARDGSAPTDEHYVLTTEMVIRESTGQVRPSGH
ncbi:LacI family transcriptional regulator [Cryobacterium cheniae]|uniref:LacI family transcriptional regulator n=2 Tax=Cryobacterium cheniae TaxID=1259262 RepID=A0A4V3IIM7_9MICO|nr:LacI family transcriptional regulator [Cryobacterium cheniae]